MWEDILLRIYCSKCVVVMFFLTMLMYGLTLWEILCWKSEYVISSPFTYFHTILKWYIFMTDEYIFIFTTALFKFRYSYRIELSVGKVDLHSNFCWLIFFLLFVLKMSRSVFFILDAWWHLYQVQIVNKLYYKFVC